MRNRRPYSMLCTEGTLRKMQYFFFAFGGIRFKKSAMIVQVTKGNTLMNRRSFLKTATAAAAGLALPGLGAAPIRRIKTGVQLYSVRKLCEQDFPGTLRAIKAMGYEGVQCGGFFGRTAKELNTLFKDHGLAAAGMQMRADQIIKPENLPASVAFASELGAP